MNVLVLGANSDLALVLCKVFAVRDRADFCLASRNLENLNKSARDLQIRFRVKVQTVPFDATAFDSHSSFYAGLNPKPDTVVLAFGYLGNQLKAQESFEEARKIIETNLLGAVSVLEVIAADFERKARGQIIIVSSVAGQRGRASNYVYGNSKAALTVYAGGLRNRLYKRNVRVLTVLPEVINTKMTDSLKIPRFLAAQPEEVAADIYHACRRGKDVLFTPAIWRWIMPAVKLIPERLFKRMPLG